MTDTSSIGPGWPPSPTSARRIKGIDTRGVVGDRGGLRSLVDTLEALAGELAAPGPDRVSLRAVVEEAVLGEHLELARGWVEAVMPLGEGRMLVYFGRNADTRPCDDGDLRQALDNVGEALTRGPVSAGSMLDRVREEGYDIRILSRAERHDDPHVLEGVADLYRRFGWSTEESRQILAHPGSLIAVASCPRQGGGEEIVCSGIAELSHLRLDDGVELRIAEFTEAATRGSHQGRGLYSAVAASLMIELARRSRSGRLLGGELDLGFGECSGHDLGVLIAARRLGRSFALSAIEERGWPFPGYLPQHVAIAGAPRSTTYNDLFPTYFSRAALYRFAES